MGDSKQGQEEKVKNKFLGKAIDNLFDAALDYARAKKFGAVLKDGAWVKWGGADQKMFEDMYLTQLAQVAVQLLMEVSVC